MSGELERLRARVAEMRAEALESMHMTPDQREDPNDDIYDSGRVGALGAVLDEIDLLVTGAMPDDPPPYPGRPHLRPGPDGKIGTRELEAEAAAQEAAR